VSRDRCGDRHFGSQLAVSKTSMVVVCRPTAALLTLTVVETGLSTVRSWTAPCFTQSIDSSVRACPYVQPATSLTRPPAARLCVVLLGATVRTVIGMYTPPATVTGSVPSPRIDVKNTFFSRPPCLLRSRQSILPLAVFITFRLRRVSACPSSRSHTTARTRM